VKDFEKQMQQAEENDVTLIDISPGKGAGNLDIAFLHPKSTSGVLIEICEDKTNN
jgi:methylmalonyl-CoA/ethylmalonyl-CoA epimerase